MRHVGMAKVCGKPGQLALYIHAGLIPLDQFPGCEGMAKILSSRPSTSLSWRSLCPQTDGPVYFRERASNRACLKRQTGFRYEESFSPKPGLELIAAFSIEHKSRARSLMD